MLTVFQILLIVIMVVFGFSMASPQREHKKLIPGFMLMYAVSVCALVITFII